jgi:hypothetical protein
VNVYCISVISAKEADEVYLTEGLEGGGGRTDARLTCTRVGRPHYADSS